MTELFGSIKSPETRYQYEQRLRVFFGSLGLAGSLTAQAEEFISRARLDPDWAHGSIDSFLRRQTQRAEKGEVQASGLSNFVKAIKFFFGANDIPEDWKSLTATLPHARSTGGERAPSLEEIQLLLTYPDRRIRPVVLSMISGGFRVGAFGRLNWGHIRPITEDEQLVAAGVTVYSGTKEEYDTFITPEAYRALRDYIQYRLKQGEDITDDSPLIRDLFSPDKGGKGIADAPRRLKSIGIKRLIEDGWRGSGIRSQLKVGRRRHDFPSASGFRRFYRAAVEQTMPPQYVKMLMGVKAKPRRRASAPTDKDLLRVYLGASRSLTVLEYPTAVPDESKAEIRRLRDDYERLLKEFEEFKGRK